MGESVSFIWNLRCSTPRVVLGIWWCLSLSFFMPGNRLIAKSSMKIIANGYN